MLYVTYKAESLGTTRTSRNMMEAQERDIQLYIGNYIDSSLEKGAELIGGNVLHDWLFSEQNPNRYITDVLAGDIYILVAYLSSLGRNAEEVTQVIDKLEGNILVAELPDATAQELKVYAKLEDSKKKFMGLRSKAGIELAKAKGKNIGGLRGKTKELNSARKKQADIKAKQLKEHLLYCRNKGYKLLETAHYLNGLGLRTVQGKEFKPMTVKRYLDRLTN